MTHAHGTDEQAHPEHPHAPHEHPTGETFSDTPEGWDARYGEAQIWSGEPNGALVAEVADLPPGQALDVGCGEGADAVWLARRGWHVTALDVSRVALDRAAAHAREAGVDIAWVHAGLVEAALPTASFDLVSAQYPALRHTELDAERALLGAVAPGGTLLLVTHADMDPEEMKSRGFDPADYVGIEDVRARLGEGWTVEVDERRERSISGGSGAHHHQDMVLRARRLSPS